MAAKSRIMICSEYLMINWEKSRLSPARRFEWFGIRWNTKDQVFGMPIEKVKSLRKDLKSFLKRTTICRRDLEKLMGRLQFASLADPICRALLESLY